MGCIAAAFVFLVAASQSGPATRTIPFQRGVNFTAEAPAGYRSADTRPMLERLRAYGVNAVALVPYGFSPPDRPAVRFGGGWERDEDIESTAKAAHQLGFQVMLKPQVWVRRGFPGDLDYAAAADRAEWFRQYRTFIEHYAQLATTIHADVFCVGVEFVRLTRYDKEWRNLIAHVRRIYSGPLTYGSAQGPEFEGIQFWDALDYIGLNEYYPLASNLSADAIVRKVEAVQRRFRRPVLLTETGFSSYDSPERAPWDETPRRLAPADQARCYQALFEAFYAKPWLAGIYWWKVGTNGYGGPNDGSHTPWGKPAMEVVRKWYRSGKR